MILELVHYLPKCFELSSQASHGLHLLVQPQASIDEPLPFGSSVNGGVLEQPRSLAVAPHVLDGAPRHLRQRRLQRRKERRKAARHCRGVLLHGLYHLHGHGYVALAPLRSRGGGGVCTSTRLTCSDVPRDLLYRGDAPGILLFSSLPCGFSNLWLRCNLLPVLASATFYRVSTPSL